MKKRDIRIDFLRGLGILLIVLAHVNPPKVISVPRMFDVPLMTFLMGMSMYMTNRKKENYLGYVIKRFKRLIVPMLLFLTVFFVSFNVVNLISATKYDFTLKTYLGSYSTLAGVGYVWIIRVFFIMSLLSPIFIFLNKKVKKITSKLIIITIALVFQEIFSTFIFGKGGLINQLINQILVISFGYAIVTQIGMWTYKSKNKDNIILIVYFAVVTGLLLIKYPYFEMATYKYPPFPIFLSYGVLISLILWYIVSQKNVRKQLEKFSVISWFSINSMKIYYWHIIPVFFIENYLVTEFFTKYWLVFYITVLTFSIAGTLLQNKIKELFNSKTKRVA